MCGKFWCGMAAGLVVGAAAGMALTPGKREMRRAAHKARKRGNCAVNEAMDSIHRMVDSVGKTMER